MLNTVLERDVHDEVLAAAAAAVLDRALFDAVAAGRYDALSLNSLTRLAQSVANNRKDLETVPTAKRKIKPWGISHQLALSNNQEGKCIIAKFLRLDPHARIHRHAHAFRTEIHVLLDDVSAQLGQGGLAFEFSSTLFKCLVVPPGVNHEFDASESGNLLVSMEFKDALVDRDRI